MIENYSFFHTVSNTKSNKNFVGWVRFITMHIGANLPTFPVNKFFPYYLCPRKWHVLLLFLATKRRGNRLFLPILSPLIFLKIPYFQPSRRHYKHDIKGLLLRDSFQRPLLFTRYRVSQIDWAQCGNFMIFLSLRFYVKSILRILEVRNMPF